MMMLVSVCRPRGQRSVVTSDCPFIVTILDGIEMLFYITKAFDDSIEQYGKMGTFELCWTSGTLACILRLSQSSCDVYNVVPRN